MTRLSYRFGPLERRGLLGPIRLGQALVLALGALYAVVVLGRAPDPAGALAAITGFGITVAVATAPAAGRTVEEWSPIAVSFAFRRLTGRARFRSPIPTRGFSIPPGPVAAVPPKVLRGVRIEAARYQDRTIGILAEGSRRLTSVLACRVVSFSLLDAEAQERRLARWGLVISGAASTAIRRVQWVERTVPAQGDELARWLHAERDPGVPPRGTPMVESYLELIGSTAPVTQEHEILLAIQVDARRVRERGADAVRGALIAETERVAQALQAAEVTVLGALSPGQVARTLRTAFDPYARAELAAVETADPTRDGVTESNGWPLALDERWDHCRSDGAFHAGYWIAGWPRVDVSPSFMDALLGRSSAVRTVAVTFEPIPPDRSTREVEAAITRDRADRELRHRFGQSETARQRQAQEATVRREAELAAGHGEVRLAGFVTVSGRDQQELRQASTEVLEHAARARLELRCMYGQQADAFTFTLPLCRGLR